jgi:hypothetical protein
MMLAMRAVSMTTGMRDELLMVTIGTGNPHHRTVFRATGFNPSLGFHP